MPSFGLARAKNWQGPGHVEDDRYPAFGKFEALSFVVKGVQITCENGNCADDFRECARKAPNPCILQFFVSAGDWSRELSILGVGRCVPVLLIYVKGKRKVTRTTWDPILHRTFTKLSYDSIVFDGSRLIKHGLLTAQDTILAVGYSLNSSSMYSQMSGLYDSLADPKDSVGTRSRGSHTIKRFGFRACANITSQGNLGRYASVCGHANKEEVFSMGDELANNIWALAQSLFIHVLKPFGYYPGGNQPVPLIALGDTPFSAGFISRNANIDPHIDRKDGYGTVIAWADDGHAQGGSFLLHDWAACIGYSIDTFTDFHNVNICKRRRRRRASPYPYCDLCRCVTSPQF